MARQCIVILRVKAPARVAAFFVGGKRLRRQRCVRKNPTDYTARPNGKKNRHCKLQTAIDTRLGNILIDTPAASKLGE